MKKGLIGLLFICLVVLVSIYIFIPDNLVISKITLVKANQNSSYRILADENQWGKWWSSFSKQDSLSFKVLKAYNYKNISYSINNKMDNAVGILIKNKDFEISSIINILPLSIDSGAIEWKCELPSGSNPVKKIINYLYAKKIKNNMADILNNLQAFLNKQENIYGIHIEQTKVKDTFLISTKSITTNYPSISFYYDLIKNLKKYITGQDVKQTGYPMLHVQAIDSIRYETMVAIPVNKQIPGSGSFLFKRMLAGGKILVTEVKGGPFIIKEALTQFENYKEDCKLASPAIPFESLVTDRSKETDTTKWLTKIYYPIY